MIIASVIITLQHTYLLFKSYKFLIAVIRNCQVNTCTTFYIFM